MLNRLRKNKLFLTVSLFVGITAFFSAALFNTQNVGAISDMAQFTFKDIHTITGRGLLSPDNTQMNIMDFSMDFIGNYPAPYQTGKVSWKTKDGVSCSGVLVIKVSNLTSDGASGSIDTLNGSESGLGSTDGNSHACRVSVYDNKRDFHITSSPGAIHPGSYDFPSNPWAATKNAVCNSDPGTQGTCFVNFENLVLACSDHVDPARSFDERKAMVGNCLRNTYPQAGAQIDQDIANMKQDIAILPSTGPNNAGELKTSCSIDGIGWIICPVMRFMAKIVDETYNVVNGMLTINPISTDTKSPLYTAWATMRSFANVAFVIAFLIIIYSQLTSVGISNYNIKKMLPRLIVAAILVNISYWLCAVAVDISNIVGQSAKSLLENIPVTAAGGQSNVNTGAGGAWDLLTIGAIAGVTLLFVDIAVLLPMLVMAAFAIITVVLVLTMRQALIVILIVISPLAFVAYLLPNTESLFKKWMDLFKVLLLMFPIIAVIFGGSRLASAIITEAANDPHNKDTNFLLQAMAAGVTIIPLFLTPVVMKAAGGLLNRFGGMVNNPNKGPFDRMRKGAEGIRDRRKEANLMNALDPKKRSMLGRGAYSRFKDRRSRTHKAGMAGYENRLQSQWANSQAGQAATDALKGTELQTEIDKAAADVRYKTTGDLDLQLKARLGKMDVDAYQAEQDALLKEISSVKGASGVTGVSDQIKLQAQHAAQDKNINDLRAGSAERVLQQEQAANIQDLATGQAQYAGGVDDYGTQRVIASAVAQKKKARLENVQSEQSTMTEASSQNLVAMMNNGGATIEHREAAAGLLAERGGDTDIHAALDTLASMDLDDKNTTALQQAMHAGLQKAGRTPQSLSASKMGDLQIGQYTGTLQNQMIERTESLNVSGQKLASMETGELATYVQTITAARGQFNQEQKDALKSAIDEALTNATLKGKLKPRSSGLMNDLKNVL